MPQGDVEFQPWEALGNPRYTPLKNGWKLESENTPLKRTTISESNLHSWVPFVNFLGSKRDHLGNFILHH